MKKISGLECPKTRFPEAGTLKRDRWEYERLKKGIEGLNALVEIAETQAADSHTEQYLNGNLDARLGLKMTIYELENRLFKLEGSLPRVPEKKLKRKSIFNRILTLIKK